MHVLSLIVISWLLVALVLSENLSMDESYYLIEERVVENLDYLMNQPKFALEVFDDFYSNGGFPNNLQAPDRNFALETIFSLIFTYRESGQRIYYGLEDGTFVGYVHADNIDFMNLMYREPGESGYSLNENQTDEKVTYFNVCIDSDYGKEQNCSMKVGDDYISCIDDCNLILCKDEESQLTNCSSYGLENDTECESKIKWCRNYEVKNAMGIEGYIPRYKYCYNSKGAISEQPGEIMTNVDGKLVFGDCTFESGELVHRNLTGAFAQCHPNERCNTTYMGGTVSNNYDPRYREWYVSAKKKQNQGFSQIYSYDDSKVSGITFYNPIYTTDESKTIFYGVMAADLPLDGISRYLRRITRNTNHTYGICEDKPPHLMIAVSTGTSLTICSDNQADEEECEVMVMLSINDLGNDNAEDMMLRKGHEVLDVGGFVTKNSISLTKDDKLDSLLYIASSQIYEQPGKNLKWRIVTVWPLKQSGENEITTVDNSFWVIVGLACTGCVVILALFTFFFKHRNERLVQLADFQLTSAFLIGCAMVNLSALLYLGENADISCNVSSWIPLILILTTISILCEKMHRLYILVGTLNSSEKYRKISNRKAWLYILSIPFIELVILTIFTLVDPLKATSMANLATPPEQSVVCHRNHMPLFRVIQIIYLLLVMVYGASLGYQLRNIDSKFADIKVLLFAMYNISFIGIVYLTIVLSITSLDQSDIDMIATICIFMGSVSSSAAIVMPRLKRVEMDRLSRIQSLKSLIVTSTLPSTKYSPEVSRNSIHESDETFKILICSSNMGNAAPTLSSLKAWIPEAGFCASVIDDETFEANKFQLIVIGMQEATWSEHEEAKEQENDSQGNDKSPVASNIGGKKTFTRQRSSFINSDEDNYLASVEGEDTIILQNMEKIVLGPDYISIAQVSRGQMRLHIYAWKAVAPLIENVKVSGTNTGVGNVMANKGGITVSLEYEKTRFSFLSAHLAAHEGESYYRSRCKNMCDILRLSQTFDLSKITDLAVSSHHMFVVGDLNFRTNIASKNIDKVKNMEHVLQLIEAKDWSSLNSYDELSAGLKRGDLLVGFETLPCNFSPTFKCKRSAGFEYNQQRTPSYTDRILYRSAKGLRSHLKELAYEPCVDFITSDHKPIRGAFSVILNDMIEPITLPSTFQLIFSDMECSDLLSADVNGFSDPYVMFVWDSIILQKAWGSSFSFLNVRNSSKSKWPRTTRKKKTLNPKWHGNKFAFTSASCLVNYDAAIYLVVYDHDIGRSDDFLGALCLSLPELVSMEHGVSEKETIFDRPLEHFGKHAGRIKFKVQTKLEADAETKKDHIIDEQHHGNHATRCKFKPQIKFETSTEANEGRMLMNELCSTRMLENVN